jgi:hypothetical protein
LLVSTITNFVTDKRIYLDYFCKRSSIKNLYCLPETKFISGKSWERMAQGEGKYWH